MNKIFEHILVPYNGCPGSQKAFKKAIDLTQLTNSKITILTCLEDRATFGLFKTKTQKQEFEKLETGLMYALKTTQRKSQELEDWANGFD